MKRPLYEVNEEKRLTVLKNRISARRSVERRNQLILSLQQQNEILLAKNRSLEDKVRSLESQLGSVIHSVPAKPLA